MSKARSGEWPALGGLQVLKVFPNGFPHWTQKIVFHSRKPLIQRNIKLKSFLGPSSKDNSSFSLHSVIEILAHFAAY